MDTLRKLDCKWWFDSFTILAATSFCFLFFTRCKSPDIEKEKAAIVALMEGVRDAHLTKDAKQFYAPYAAQWYDVRDGRIQIQDKSTSVERTQSYLDQMEFLALEKLQDPIVEISSDASMASYIGSVLVKGRLSKDPVFWLVAWESVLKRQEGLWKVISTTNTEVPQEQCASIILEKVREATGSLPDTTIISASANCSGPIGDFRTLMISGMDKARMEQKTSGHHMILKYGPDSSWTFNPVNQSMSPKMDTLSRLFVQGHEFHWLTHRPEDRYSQPVFNGFSTFAGKTAFKIVFQDALHRNVNFYYDFENYMPLGMENPTHSDAERVILHFLDWEKPEDLQLVQKVVIKEGEVDWIYEFTDIQIHAYNSYDMNKSEALIKE